MKLLFIQISDLHFSTEHPIDQKRADSVGRAIANAHVQSPDGIVLVYSGDFVWSGQKEDYSKVTNLLKSVEVSIAEAFPDKQIARVFCPGNHDCTLPSREGIRKMVIENAIKGPAFKGDFFEEALAVHENFFNFAEDFDPNFKSRNLLWPNVSNRLGWQSEIRFGSTTLNFICLNSAWLSLKHEDPGVIHFPDDDFLTTETPVDLTIGVFHHPLSWMNPETAHRLRTSFLNRCDLLFTGHEHQPMAFTLRDELNRCEVKLIEGASFADHAVPNNDGFVSAMLDLEALRIENRNYRWNAGGYSPFVGKDSLDFENPEHLGFSITKKSSSGRLPQYSKEFDEWIEDAGLPLFTSDRSGIPQSEIYVFPELRSLRIKGAATLNKAIIGADNLLEQEFVLILGPSNSGKTSLAKEVCRRTSNGTFSPLYIDSRKLRAHQANFAGYLQKNIEQQYGSTETQFTQRSTAEKIVILDDFHAFAVNSKPKKIRELLELIKSRFGKLIILGNDIEFSPAELSTIFGDSSWGIPVGFSLQPFSLRKRNELISRWLKLNQSLSPAEQASRLVETNRTFDAIIGRNFVQPFPAYLLAVLQGIESGREIDLSTSTHGHFYEIFIKSCLAKKATATNYNIFSNFLGLLAYRAFTEEISVMGDDFFQEVHKEFQEEYDVVRSVEGLKANLLDIGLLVRINGCYCFSEKFVLYYFTAYYIKDRLSEVSVRNEVSNMANKLWVEDYANVMLFLVHLSKDPFVVGEIEARINGMFHGFPEATLQDDVKFLESYGGDVIDLNVPERLTNEDRLEELEQSRSESLMPEFASAPARDVAVANVDDVARFNAAIKAMQLLGQVLKNFPASFKATRKAEMATNCLDLGLRCLGFYFNLIRIDEKQVLSDISEMLMPQKKDPTEKEKLEFAKSFVHWMCRHMTFGIVKRISYSIGSRELERTYARIFIPGVSDAYKLVNLSLILDHQGDFPERLIAREFVDWSKTNLFVANQSKLLVSRHFKLFDVPIAPKQATAKLMDIKLISEHAEGSRGKIVS